MVDALELLLCLLSTCTKIMQQYLLLFDNVSVKKYVKILIY